MTPAVIEPATVRFVAQHLKKITNYLRTKRPFVRYFYYLIVTG